MRTRLAVPTPEEKATLNAVPFGALEERTGLDPRTLHSVLAGKSVMKPTLRLALLAAAQLAPESAK